MAWQTELSTSIYLMVLIFTDPLTSQDSAVTFLAHPMTCPHIHVYTNLTCIHSLVPVSHLIFDWYKKSFFSLRAKHSFPVDSGVLKCNFYDSNNHSVLDLKGNTEFFLERGNSMSLHYIMAQYNEP